MRATLVFFIAASVASVSGRHVHKRGGPLVPVTGPKFNLVPLEDAKNQDDLVQSMLGNVTKGTAVVETMLENSVATSAAAACSANPNIRKEWRNTSTQERVAFIAAINCLMKKPPSGHFPPSTSRYDDFVRLHQWYMPNVHNNANFLLWHRGFIFAFEQELRNECALTTTFPWWDETLDAGNFHNSTMFTDQRYFGHLVATSTGGPLCINSGAFGGITLNIGPGNSDTTHCLSRAVNENLTSQCSKAYVDYCQQVTDYNSLNTCVQYGPHAYGHNGIGGVMGDVSSSPNDPIFWMHHTFVDHTYRIWQTKEMPARVQTVNGNDINGNPLSLSYSIAYSGIIPNIPLSAIVNTLGGVQIGGTTMCYKYDY